jgi:CheY-like chemotaxis protein
MPSTPVFSASVLRVLAFTESMTRLDVLLELRALSGKSATAKTIATACRISVLAADQHLAKLCGRGLLAVEIGTELLYSYRPIDPTTRAGVDEVQMLVLTQREAIRAWFAATQRPHVLIAEDDPDMREILRTFMESRGFRSTALPHGHEALAYAEGEALALAIVDLRPSPTPALALARALQQRPDPVRIIMTTSFADARLQSRIAGLTVSAVLEKPFELDELSRAVEGVEVRNMVARS